MIHFESKYVFYDTTLKVNDKITDEVRVGGLLMWYLSFSSNLRLNKIDNQYSPLNNLSNQCGSMLIQVLISAGLTTALALTIASLLLNQNKQIKFIEQKSEIIDIKNEILMALSNPAVCGCNLNPSKLIPLGVKPALEFDASPATLNLTEGLRSDCADTTTAFLKAGKKTLSNLSIDHIKVSNLVRDGLTSNWNGRLEVKFSGSNIQLKDLSMPINVESSGSGPFQVDTCSVVDNLDQTASCKSLGGTLQDGKCIIQDPQANCQSLGGTYDTLARKCKLNSLPVSLEDCVSTYGAGWTFNGTACVPPATSAKGTIAGFCSGSNAGGATLPSKKVKIPSTTLYTCTCETGWSVVQIDGGWEVAPGADGCPWGGCSMGIKTFACIKN